MVAVADVCLEGDQRLVVSGLACALICSEKEIQDGGAKIIQDRGVMMWVVGDLERLSLAWPLPPCFVAIPFTLFFFFPLLPSIPLKNLQRLLDSVVGVAPGRSLACLSPAEQLWLCAPNSGSGPTCHTSQSPGTVGQALGP